MCCCRQVNKRLPTPSFLLQRSSSCCKVPSSIQSCILHCELLTAPILWSLACVLIRVCNINQRKLASSVDTPGCLQFDQDNFHSVVGQRTSDLHGTKFLSSSSEIDIMVTQSSVTILVQSFCFMVVMFIEDLSLTFLMMENISSVRYGGFMDGAPGTSSASTCFL